MAEQHPITLAIALCAALHRRAPASVDAAEIAMHQLLTIFFREMALLIAKSRPVEWRVSERAGYLTRIVDGVEVSVPWHLVSGFPTGQMLSELVHLATMIRGGAASTICLSGSATGGAVVPDIADIDYCEYFDPAGTHGWTAVCRRAMLSNDSVACLEVKEFAVAQAPIPALAATRDVSTIDAFATAVNRRNTEALKCDFAAHLNSGDVVELTSVVIRASDDDKSAAGRLSFVAQEALIGSPGSWTPQDLASPRQLGAYAIWLAKQTTTLIPSSACKAAKRFLALSRLMALDGVGSQLVSVLQSGDLCVRSVLGARLALHRRLNAPGVLVRAGLRTALERAIDGWRQRVSGLRRDRRSDDFVGLAEDLSTLSLSADRLAIDRLQSLYEGSVATLL